MKKSRWQRRKRFNNLILLFAGLMILALSRTEQFFTPDTVALVPIEQVEAVASAQAWLRRDAQGWEFSPNLTAQQAMDWWDGLKQQGQRSDAPADLDSGHPLWIRLKNEAKPIELWIQPNEQWIWVRNWQNEWLRLPLGTLLLPERQIELSELPKAQLELNPS